MSRERTAAWSLAVVATPDSALLDGLIPLASPETTVGRDPGPGPALAVSDLQMSKRHLRLLAAPLGAPEVVDLHSTNGTFVAGEACPIGEPVEAAGVPIRAGATVLVPVREAPAPFDTAEPPIANHPELAPAFARRLLASRPDAGPLTAEAAEALVLQSWPGGAGDLAAIVGRVAALLRPLEAVDQSHLKEAGLELCSEPASASKAAGAGASRGAPTEAEIRSLMASNEGSVRACSASLGVARKQVYRWLKRYGIDPEEYRK
jgi:hypothetical protein